MKYVLVMSVLSLIGAIRFGSVAQETSYEAEIPVQVIEFTTPIVITPSK